MGDSLGADDASRAAALDFTEGPSLRDAIGPALELVGHTEWLARPVPAEAARGHGLETTGWMRKRFGLGNL